MTGNGNRAPLSVYMLADHLDGALAAGEDLVRRGSDWKAWVDTAASPRAQDLLTQRQILDDIRSFELMLTARILKARDHAAALGKMDGRFAPVSKAFAAGTAQLVDAVAEADDASATDFETGDSVLAYARSRALISPHVSDIPSSAHLLIDDQFLVARRIALGPLLDMAAAFLDALDIHYELFADDADEQMTELADGHTSTDDDAAVTASN